jgi:hypothetical protein
MEHEFFNLITKINGENFILVAFAVGLYFVLKRMAVISTNDSAILADWTELNSALARKDDGTYSIDDSVATCCRTTKADLQATIDALTVRIAEQTARKAQAETDLAAINALA